MKILTVHPVYGLEKGFFNRDLGQIGYTLMNEKNYLSEIWLLKKKSQKDFNIKGQKWVGFNNKFFLYTSLFLRARKFNVLQMYHIRSYSFLGSIIFKLINPKGIVYIKSDMPFIGYTTDSRKLLNKIPRIIMYIYLYLVDYIGFEDKRLQNFMINSFPKFKKKFIFTTNGAIYIKNTVGNIKKDNIISLCGRFGTRQKNNEILLKILKNKDNSFLNGWKIYLIGSYTKKFEEKLNKLFITNPKLKNIIIKTGFLETKNELYGVLQRSKIFLHTASWEGDPNIQYDAMFCGCFMISTDVANIKQNYPKQYSIFYNIEDEIGLHNSLKKGIKISNSMKKLDFQNIQNYCLKKYIWKKSLKELINKLGNYQ